MTKENHQFRIDKEKVVWRTVDGEAVILNLDDGLYYTLNKAGSRIWEQLAEGKTVEGIASEIAARFGAQAVKVQQDIVDLISDLKKAKLAEV